MAGSVFFGSGRLNPNISHPLIQRSVIHTLLVGQAPDGAHRKKMNRIFSRVEKALVFPAEYWYAYIVD
jgi:hypothetical protein